MESYSKYADMARVPTCLLIDEPPIVLLGRTFSELTATIIAFLVLAYFDMPWWGLVAAIVVGGVLPLYRIRFVRGHVQHVAWSCGLWFPEVGMFSPRRPTRVMGP